MEVHEHPLASILFKKFDIFIGFGFTKWQVGRKRVDGSGLESFRRKRRNDRCSIFCCLCKKCQHILDELIKRVDKLTNTIEELTANIDAIPIPSKKIAKPLKRFWMMKKIISRSLLNIRKRRISSPVAPLSVLSLADFGSISKVTSSNEKNEVRKTALGFSAVRVDLELDFKEVLMKVSDEKKKDEEHRKMDFDPAADGKLINGIEVQDFVEKGSLVSNVCDVKGIDEEISVVYAEEDSKFVNKNIHDQCDTNGVRLMKLNGDDEDCIIRKRKYSDGKMSNSYDEEHLKIDVGNGDVQGGTDDIGLTKLIGNEEGDITRKRKRESSLDMLKWVTELAKDPCDPAIGQLPEKSKWKSYGNEVAWKKILLLRDEVLLERNVDTSTQCSIWQQKQKMHPSMYDDNIGSELLRSSQRVLSAKDSLKNSGSYSSGTLIDGPTDSSAESGVLWNRQRKKITSFGSEFQVDIPEWKKDIYESDAKWLGTRIWPLDKNEQRRILIERDPTGKGREDTCGCEYPGSYDCIKFHLSEKRKKLKLELGSAFYHWKFDYMGEKVALSWTTKDEQKFHDIAKSSPLSEDESFSYWPELFKFFPYKSRESLVSYYFNVFLLRRIGQQNRMHASDVDSDDDESGYGPRSICFGRDPKFSILCSPKKARRDPR